MEQADLRANQMPMVDPTPSTNQCAPEEKKKLMIPIRRLERLETTDRMRGDPIDSGA